MLVATDARVDLQFEAAKPLLDTLWATTLDLGRTPEADEVANLAALDTNFGGLSKALRLMARRYDQTMLEGAAEARADDVRLYGRPCWT